MIKTITIEIVACHDGASNCAKMKLKSTIAPQTNIRMMSKNRDGFEFNSNILFKLFLYSVARESSRKFQDTYEGYQEKVKNQQGSIY